MNLAHIYLTLYGWPGLALLNRVTNLSSNLTVDEESVRKLKLLKVQPSRVCKLSSHYEYFWRETYLLSASMVLNVFDEFNCPRSSRSWSLFFQGTYSHTLGIRVVLIEVFIPGFVMFNVFGFFLCHTLYSFIK